MSKKKILSYILMFPAMVIILGGLIFLLIMEPVVILFPAIVISFYFGLTLWLSDEV